MKVEGGESRIVEGTVVSSLKVNGDNVTHIQFTKWPNYGVVENVGELGLLVKAVADEQTARGLKKAPILIHST